MRQSGFNVAVVVGVRVVGGGCIGAWERRSAVITVHVTLIPGNASQCVDVGYFRIPCSEQSHYNTYNVIDYSLNVVKYVVI
jgi:hypothetical protein